MKNLKKIASIIVLTMVLFAGNNVFGQEDCIKLPPELEQLINHKLTTHDLQIKGTKKPATVHDKKIITYLKDFTNGLILKPDDIKKKQIQEQYNKYINLAKKDSKVKYVQNLIKKSKDFDDFLKILYDNKEHIINMEGGGDFFINLYYSTQILIKLKNNKKQFYKLTQKMHGPNIENELIYYYDDDLFGCAFDILSGAASGAYLGSFAGPWGAAIGGVIGAGIGLGHCLEQ